MNDRRFLVPFINLGHLLDHLVMLVFPTVVIALGREWNRPYSEMLPLALGGFIAFGAFALPAGWLADHWSRYRMMAVFFFGIGASLALTGFAKEPWQIAAGLTLTGMFAAIYHPVGIAMLVAAPKNLGMALGWNGLWGNLGLAFAAIVSGALMDLWGWRAAFFIPGLLAMAAGVAFLLLVPDPGPVEKKSKTIGLHLDARTMTQIFVMVRASRCRPMVLDFFSTGPGSGTSSRNATPAAIASRPGMKNAARQPHRSMSAPETIAAKARPRLPHNPFQPSAMPRFFGAATSIAMPTGW